MGELNLDAIHAARAEQDGDPHVITFQDVQYTIPPQAPYRLLERLAEFAALSNSLEQGEQARAVPALSSCMELVLGAEQWKAIADSADQGDVFALVNGVTKLYGMGDLGEPPGSVEPSPNTGEQQPQTSNGNISSISPEPASAPNP